MLIEDADQFGMPARAIEVAGPQVVPALLAAVSDPRFRGGSQKSSFGTTVEPLEGVLSCLQSLAPPEAVAVVLPLVTDKNDMIRKEVALLLGTIASDEAAEPLVQLLQDEDDYVRCYGMMGVLRAHEAGRISEGFRPPVFEAIAPLAFRRVMSGGDDAARCLLVLDREKAIPLLSDPSKVRADQENLPDVMEALRDANVQIDEPLLLAILDDLDGNAEEYPERNVVGETLLMLATIGSDTAARAIERHQNHPSKDVRQYAAEAQSLLIGIDNPIVQLWERVEGEGWESLTVPQQHTLAVRVLIDEVNNGGFLQYFVNSSGSHWQEALAGLKAIGAQRDAVIFSEVLAQFGNDKPSTDRSKRHGQTAQIAEKNDRPFEQWERDFYKDHDGREALLLQYILKHREDFGASD
ncbi:DMP19 family protein [Aeoliella sp.]|uniref:DMP19 family protein n=1 Tax=Aeoliella sp. TaxID=2795800 RepID=UPI003CCBF4F9